MSTNTSAAGFTLSNATYDKIKFLVTILLPAFAALYVGLAQFWGFPRVEEVVGTVTALATFLGVTLGVSSKNYSSEEGSEPSQPIGSFILRETVNGKAVVLDLEQDPATLEVGSLITFRLKEDVAVDEEDELL